MNEEWITDWRMRESTDRVMGKVSAKAMWVKMGEVEDGEFLDGGWEEEEGGELVEAFVESLEGGWTARQVGSVRMKRRFMRLADAW